jgi:nicotinamide-nucleotide amidase
MKVRILNIGDEVLNGYVLNTNATYLASKVNELGFTNSKIVIVKDDFKEIESEVMSFLKTDEDILITTGGLGPTHDDITKEAIASALDLEMVYYEKIEKNLKEYLGDKFPTCNFKQAFFPKNSKLLNNKNGTADGAIIEKDNKIIIILVGPPAEMIPMFQDEVIPFLKTKYHSNELVKDFIIMGIAEALVDEKTQYLEEKYNLKIAAYVECGYLRLQIRAKDENSFNKGVFEINNNLEKHIISNNEIIEEVIVNKLLKFGYKLSFAESCTGGLLASSIINVSGSSAVLSESLICYSNEVKRSKLKVKKETLDKYGEISTEVAFEMAKGLFETTNSHVCISTTGIAGPTNPYPNKSLGLICYSIKINEKYYNEEKTFKGNRNIVRLKASRWILYRLFTLLKEKI